MASVTEDWQLFYLMEGHLLMINCEEYWKLKK